MTAKIISGREVAEQILTTDLKNKVIALNENNIKPKLVVVLVGDVKASASYVAQKEKFAVKAGIESEVRRFKKDVTEDEILTVIDNINNDKYDDSIGFEVQNDEQPEINEIFNQVKSNSNDWNDESYSKW